MTRRLQLNIPDVLRGPAVPVEELFTLVSSAPTGRRVTLDLSGVSWVCPYGAVALLGACRYLAQRSGEPVRIAAMRDSIHAYLRRIDFFERSTTVAFTDASFNPMQELGRSPASTNVLELVAVGQPADVYEVANRAQRILSFWLGGTSDDMSRVVSLLAEACNNVVDHSGDTGVVTIQKYVRGPYTEVELAISDLGIGIRRSLTAVHGEVADSTTGFIERALAGLSARHGRGGQGLGAIQRIATASGGHLFIRSETGSVRIWPGGSATEDGLSFFPGTQIAITFRGQ
jgi:anti-sigma regulatory factor (Ser/Thr protein kinase)